MKAILFLWVFFPFAEFQQAEAETDTAYSKTGQIIPSNMDEQPHFTDTEQKERRQLGVELSGGLSGGEYQGAASGLVMNTGANRRAGIVYRPLSWVMLHAGYGVVTFGCNRGFCSGQDVQFTGNGLDFGVKLRKSGFWVGAGLLHHNLNISWDENTRQINPMDTTPGYNIRGGFYIPISKSVELEAGLLYSEYKAGFSEEAGMHIVSYLNSEIRLRIFLF